MEISSTSELLGDSVPEHPSSDKYFDDYISKDSQIKHS